MKKVLGFATCIKLRKLAYKLKLSTLSVSKSDFKNVIISSQKVINFKFKLYVITINTKPYVGCLDTQNAPEIHHQQKSNKQQLIAGIL